MIRHGVSSLSSLLSHRRGREDLVLHEQLLDAGQPGRDGRHRGRRVLLREQRQLVQRQGFHGVRHVRRDHRRGHVFLRVRRFRQHRHVRRGSQGPGLFDTGGHDHRDERRLHRFVGARVSEVLLPG